jgi:hypothetical protein
MGAWRCRQPATGRASAKRTATQVNNAASASSTKAASLGPPSFSCHSVPVHPACSIVAEPEGMTPSSCLQREAEPSADPLSPAPGALVEIVIPVRNEECDLGPSVRRLRNYLVHQFPLAARITIADNGSDDGTWARARELEEEFSEVRAIRLPQPGRGGALASLMPSAASRPSARTRDGRCCR